MVKKVFASYSFSGREKYRTLDDGLRKYFSSKGIGYYAFVFEFSKKLDDRKLMDAALEKIDEADTILIEVSEKSIGVGVEAGYAKAKGKKIIYLHKRGTEIKQTINGISDFVVEYENASDITKWMEENNNLFA